jgi:hypothetical protein
MKLPALQSTNITQLHLFPRQTLTDSSMSSQIQPKATCQAMESRTRCFIHPMRQAFETLRSVVTSNSQSHVQSISYKASSALLRAVKFDFFVTSCVFAVLGFSSSAEHFELAKSFLDDVLKHKSLKFVRSFCGRFCAVWRPLALLSAW